MTSSLKSALLLVAVLVWVAPCFSQNLVSNPNFEIYTECPFGINGGDPLECIPWDHCNGGTTDYYNRCAFPLDAGVPDNAFGYQEPISGDAYLGFKALSTDNNREYAMSPLNTELTADSTYLVTFFITVAEDFCYTNAFGALFTIGPPVGSGGQVLNYSPQIEVYGGFLNDYQNWMTISRCFVADGGENYITLGNFRDSLESLYDPECPLGGDFVYHAYYYLDSVSVVKLPASFDEFTLDDVSACGSYEIDPGPAENYTWSDGTTNPTLTVTESGTYAVTLSNGCDFSYGEIEVTILQDSPPVELPADTMLCEGESLEIFLDSDAGDYAWQDQSSDDTYVITSSGTYSVTLTDECDVTEDEITVTFISPPGQIDIGDDVTLCPGDQLNFDFDPLIGSYVWQDGSTSASYTITEPGIYALTVSNICGQAEDEIIVAYDEPIDFSLGPDEQMLCAGDEILIELDPGLGSFLWQDQSEESSFLVTSGGTVSVTITNSCFSESDEIEVMLVESPVFTLGADITVCPGQLPITFDLSAVEHAEDYLWNDDFTGSVHQISAAGMHSVTISNACFSISDDINITIADADPVVTLPQDQMLCAGQSLILDAGGLMGNYQWSTSIGSVTDADTLLVTGPGTYYLTVTNICGSGSDSVTIDYIPPLIPPNLGIDFSLCPGETGVLYANTDGVSYLWRTSTDTLSFADSLIVNTPGTYFLQINDACTSASDTIVITSNANPPDVDLPEALDLCEGDTIVINAGVTGVQYLWNDASQLSSLSINAPGSYSLTVSNACGSDIDSILINDAGAAPTVSLGTDLSICPGDAINIVPVSSEVDSWLWNSSAGTSTTDSVFIADIAGTLIVEGTNACGSAFDTIVVTMLPDVTPLDLGNDLTLCPGETVTLTITASDVEIVWNDQSTGNQFIVTEEGTVYATISNACSSSSDTMIVTMLDDIPALYLGEDQSLCPGETITLDPGIAGVTYLWQNGSNASTFQTEQPGTIILIISNACGSSSDTLEIIEDTNGPQLDLGPDILACEGDTVILDAGISGVEYLWSNASTSSATTVTSSEIITLTVTNACGSDMDTIVVDIHGTTPTPSLGVDTTLCDEEVLILLSSADAETDIEWSDGSDTPSLMVSGAGIYILYESNHCGSASDTIEVSYQSAPEPFDLGEDAVLCLGESIVLNAPVTTDLITWQDASTGSVSTGSTTAVNTSTTIILTIANDCGTKADEINISFDQQVPVVELGEPLSLCPDASLILDVSQAFIATYLWSTGSIQPSIEISQPDLYAVTVSTDCYSEVDQILIEADENCSSDLFIPNIFSPNADSINDEWMVLLSDSLIAGVECRIFDRWGDIVFESKELPIVWDGVFNNKNVLPGVYVYLLKLKSINGEIRVLSGDFTLIR